MLYILFAILFFGFLIAIHEFGHFITAKLSGVRVNEFSIGMGPQLWHRKRGETEYSLRALPIGGFCAMEGEDEASDDPRSFSSAKLGRKILILVAGSAMNFIAGLLILVILFSGSETYVAPVLSSFDSVCPAAEQGYLQTGDEILKVDGHRIFRTNDITLILSRGNGETADLVIRREGETLHLEDVPMALHEYETDGKTVARYGVYFTVKPTGFLHNVGYALASTASFARSVWFGLIDLVTGSIGLQEMAGPIGIVNMMSEVGTQAPSFRAGVINLLYLGSFIAINLAVMNLLPLPALDGGRLFFLLLNSLLMLVLKRKIPDQYEGYVHMAGMFLLLGLMLIVGINDVRHLIGS